MYAAFFGNMTQPLAVCGEVAAKQPGFREELLDALNPYVGVRSQTVQDGSDFSTNPGLPVPA
jgi:hypothetical protein